MKHLSIFRLLPWALIALCPPLLGHCGGAVEHGTETGNPPVVEQQKLHVVLRDTGVEVVGEAGAVGPGASVRVTNRSTGDQANATARADGSVNVVVPGSLQDEYEVTVSNGTASNTVTVSATSSGSTDPTGTNGSGTNSLASDAELASASCNTLENTLGQRVASGFSGGSTACQTDDDCVYTGWGAGCYYQCGSSFLSEQGAALAQAQVEGAIAPVCSELASRCTRQPPSSCPGTTTSTAQCANGVCQGLELGALSCDALESGASARLGSLERNADRSCTEDADCTLATPRLRCVASCGIATIALAISSLPALTSGVERIENDFCGAFAQRPCAGPIPPPCGRPPGTEQPPQAKCTAGLCEVSQPPP